MLKPVIGNIDARRSIFLNVGGAGGSRYIYIYIIRVLIIITVRIIRVRIRIIRITTMIILIIIIIRRRRELGGMESDEAASRCLLWQTSRWRVRPCMPPARNQLPLPYRCRMVLVAVCCSMGKTGQARQTRDCTRSLSFAVSYQAKVDQIPRISRSITVFHQGVPTKQGRFLPHGRRRLLPGFGIRFGVPQATGKLREVTMLLLGAGLCVQVPTLLFLKLQQ